MAAVMPITPAGDLDPITRASTPFAGMDGDTLRKCPRSEWGQARAIALLILLVWAFQAGELALFAQALLAPDGALHPALVLGAVFVATFLLAINSYFLRVSFEEAGIRELARAGLDLSGGFATKLASLIYLNIRNILALAVAQLSAIILSLFIYHAEVVADLQQHSNVENAAIIAAARSRVDAEIQYDQEAEKAAQQRVDALQKQIALNLSYLRSPATWHNAERARQAQAALTDLQHDFGSATSELAARREDLKARMSGRDNEIQKAIDDAPDHTDTVTGFLAQISALRRIARNPEAAFVIFLVNVIAFGFELTPLLLVKMKPAPTYAASLARDRYIRSVAIADEIVELANKSKRVDATKRMPSGTPRPGSHTPSNVTWFPVANDRGPGAVPPKRPRGRPRKDSLNGGSPSPSGENKRGQDEDDEGQ